jgi:type II secretory pathway component PulC
MKFGCLLALISIVLTFLFSMVGLSQFAADQGQKENPYQVIIKNNLFRPLGWNPKPSKPPYQLLGTVIIPGGQSKALIRMGGSTIYVKVGERIGGAVLKEVHEKRVVLEEGEGKTIDLKIEQIGFIGSKGGRSFRKGQPGPKSGAKPERMEKPPRPLREAFERIRREIPREALRRIPPEIREKFMRASPEEKRRMIEEFRRRFRGRRR